KQLSDLKAGRPIEMPQYDFVHHRRRADSIHVEPRPLVIIEGLMVLYDKQIRDLLDLKLYVDTPDDIRFIRRLNRDMTERGRTVESVVRQYLEVVRPGHFSFIEPTKEFADIVIPEGGHNENALRVLITFVKDITR
ncbi:MAG: uridine kinase, partial [Spirochaetes bacterium GWF2_52_7]